MIVRFGGGKSGIAEYLITGKKQGRDNTRDELDARVTLTGDLSVTNSIIKSMTTNSDKYIHFTLSFKEDEISIDTLKDISDDYKTLLMNAFRDDEYNIYMEAHLPKIKTITNKETGELSQRYIHIHGVIPKTNLLTGQYLNPIGKAENNVKHLDAIQEFINNKYGLSSPKDNKRTNLTNAAEIVSRWKNDFFGKQGKSLKNEIIEIILNEDISSFNGLATALENVGTVKVVNSKMHGQYINIKMPDSKKGVNLKDFVFTDEFLKLSLNEKYMKLSGADAGSDVYNTVGSQRENKQSIADLVEDWQLIHSHEIKLINSGSKRLYAEYKAMSREDKINFLESRAIAFYKKHDSLMKESFNYEPRNRQQSAEKIKSIAKTESINNLRKLSELGLDVNGKRPEMLLRTNETDNVGISKTEADLRLRRSERIVDKSDINKCNLIDQLILDQSEIKKQNIARVKKEIPTAFLLNRLAETHGLQINKYKTIKAKDDTDRISCGTRNLNIADFLVKEMHMNWSDAENYIVAADADYKADNTALESKPITLREEFEVAAKSIARDAWNEQDKNDTALKSKLKSAYDAAMLTIKNNTGTDKSEKIKQGKSVQEQYNSKLSELEAIIKQERRDLYIKLNKNKDDLYLEWLADQHNKHNRADAFDELIHLSAKQIRAEAPAGDFISPNKADLQQEKQPIIFIKGFQRTALNTGVVLYKRKGQVAIQDNMTNVAFKHKDDAAILAGLQISIKKFGNELKVNGNDEFKLNIARVAAQNNLDIKFCDEKTERLFKTAKAEAEKSFRQQTRSGLYSTLLHNKDSNEDKSKMASENKQDRSRKFDK